MIFLPSQQPKERRRNIPSAERRALARRYGAEWGLIVAAQCYWCGVEDWIEWRSEFTIPSWPCFYHSIDHLIPVARGGTNEESNLVLACLRCNISRGAKSPHEYLQFRALDQLVRA